MKLQNLHIDESLQSLERIEASLEGKTLVAVNLKATDPNPELPYAQIIHITAIATSADTGVELGLFNEEAELEIATMSRLRREDNLKARDEWPDDKMAVRDWLNANGYDLAAAEAGGIQKPSDLEVAIAFQDFYEEYDFEQVLVAHNIPFVLGHLNHILPYPLDVSQDIDTLGFARKFFLPLLRLKMTSGHDTANRIGEKMLDSRGNLDASTRSLSRAFGVGKTRHRSNAVEEVRQLAKVFYKMVGFVRLHRDMLDHPHFKQYDTLQSQARERDDLEPENLEPEEIDSEEPAQLDEPAW